MRRRLLTTSSEGIAPSKAQPCDIVLCNKTTNKLLIVPNNEFSSDSYPSSIYSPVGVVVIPGSHNVYGDGSCGVISIVPMNCSTPTTGGTSEEGIYWGKYGTNISTLPNLNKVPYVGIDSDVGNSSSTVVGQYSSGYLPSDKFITVQCPHDTDTYYLNNSTSYRQAPSPFLTDGSRNPAYYQTSSPSSTSNALADFDGVGNTDKIVAKRGTKDYTSWKPTSNTEADYPAASCCDMYYTDGTKQGDWYLPACGELGYIIPNLNKISTAISTLANTYGVGVWLANAGGYWASSEYSNNYANRISTNFGSVGGHSKGQVSYTRAFLRIK